MDRRADRRLDADPLSLHRLAGPRSLGLILPILLLGVLLRIPLLARDVRFQPDEALYATFARHVASDGPLLIGVPLDKPPLVFWLIGGSFRLFGATEFAARLPNLAASLFTIAATYALARRLYGDSENGRWVALIAALLVAVSPFDRAFAATAFTDPILTLCVVLGCLLAVADRPRLAGVAMAIAFFAKPSALEWLPLVAALGLVSARWVALRRLILAFGLAVLPLLAWSVARDTTPDFWTLNLYNNTPGRLIRANEWWPRLQNWAGYLGTIAPAPLFGWLAIPLNLRLSRATLIDVLLSAWSIGFLASLWLIAFNTYDRYLHTLAPFALLLMARTVAAIAAKLDIFEKDAIRRVILFAAICLSPLLTAQITVGGNLNDYVGIDRAAAILNRLPPASRVYDHWLGWELGFYLGDRPSVAIVWEATIANLIAEASTQPGYLIAPASISDPWLSALRAAGFDIQALTGVPDGFVIVHLEKISR